MRTKQVVINSTAGARLRTVNINMICSADVIPSRLVHTFGPPPRKLVISLGGELAGGGSADCAIAELTQLSSAIAMASQKNQSRARSRKLQADRRDRQRKLVGRALVIKILPLTRSFFAAASGQLPIAGTGIP
jgi:hypothetical protein